MLPFVGAGSYASWSADPPPTKRLFSMRLICVLGMHRSGTSAVAGLLTEMGAHPGDTGDLLDPQPDNPRGFFEHRELMGINKRLLHMLGGYWSSPPSLPRGWELREDLDEERVRAAELIQRLGADAHDWVVLKDPRLSLVFPFWTTVHPITAVVTCIRHPFDVAASLARRNGLPLTQGAYLWLRYTTAALEVEPQPHLVFYERLVNDPAGIGRSIGELMDLSPDQAKIASDNTIDPGLQHQRQSAQLSGPIGEAAMTVYEALIDGAESISDMPPEARVLAHLHLGMPWIELRSSDIESAKRESRVVAEKAQRELVKSQNALATTKERLSASERRREEFQHRVQSQRHDLGELRSEVKELRANFTRQSDQLLDLQDVLATTRAALETRMDELRNVRGEAADLHSIVESRSEEIHELTGRIRQLESRREDAERRYHKAQTRYERLRNRRTVRLSLWFASLARPLFLAVRSVRSRIADLKAYMAARRAANTPIPQPEGQFRKSTEQFDEELAERARAWIDVQYRVRRSTIDATKVSVIMPTYNRADTIVKAVESVRSQSHKNWELIIVDDGSTDRTTQRLGRYADDDRIRILTTENAGVSAARNLGQSEAGGDLLFFLDSDNSWQKDHVRNLIVAMAATNADCAYTALHVVGRDGKTTYFRGERFDRAACLQGNYVDLNVFAIRPDRTVAFETRLRRMVDWDYILRATQAAIVTYVPVVGCEYLDSDDEHRISRREPLLWDRILRARHSSADGLVPWDRIAADLKLSFAIKIPAPRVHKDEWGDYHFAVSLKDAFERLGHDARIDFLREWELGTPTDVNLVLRGLSRYDPPASALNVMWNISHPDKVSDQEYRSFHIVYVASDSYASLLSFQMGADVTVRPLIQATDASRFSPRRRHEKSPFSAEILFVGNTRNEYRDIVKWAIEAGLDPMIHGRGWSQFLPADRVNEELIDNRELGAAYAGSGVVLNDHWPSMRDFAIVSNRVFDVAATGTRVVSDPHPALGRIFGDAVIQVDSAEALRETLAQLPPTNVDRLADWIGTHHTFDSRAQQIVSDLLSWMNLPLQQVGTRPKVADSSAFLTSPRSRPRRPKIGLMVTDGAAGPQSSAFIRLINPLTTEHALERLDVRRVWDDDIPDDLDVCVIQRTTIARIDDAEQAIERLERSGARVIVDLDDAFNLIGSSHPEFERYREKSQAVEHLLQRSSQQWFSTEELRDGYSHVHLGDTRIMPNSLDPRMWRQYRRSSESAPPRNERPRILYMGTATHDADFESIFPQLRELHDDVDFEVVLIGAVRGATPDEPWLKKLELPRGISLYPRFTRWLRSMGPFDIGISPLEDTPFNRAKSDIKFLDYSALGVVSVLADLCPYWGTTMEKELALLAKPGEWAKLLHAVCSDPESYDDMRHRATEYLWSERSTEQAAEKLVSSVLEVAESGSPKR